MLGKTLGTLAAGALMLGGAQLYTAQNKVPEDPREKLAKCLSRRGFTLYGTSWCGWCQKQLDMFGDAQKLVPYRDCTGPDGKGWDPECRRLGIQVVPSWTTGDGRVLAGTQSLHDLAYLSKCAVEDPK
eukprot:m.127268 g.127268  ORF g.127268 m.127268 type:complete len:128 (-) comp14542_c0_seq1:2033-2416(-)